MTREEITKEFGTISDLIKFVLVECMDLESNIDYEYIFLEQIVINLQFLPHAKNIDIQKISYLDNLLKTGFGVSIDSLSIPSGANVSNSEYLVKMWSLRRLRWPEGEEIPELPDSIDSIIQCLPKPTRVRDHLYGHGFTTGSYMKVLDHISKGKIKV